MKCTATTSLTSEQCMERLAAYDFDFSRPKFAARLMHMRAERRALREALADVIGPPCEKRTRWCFTHQTNDCRADEARKLLVTP